MTHHILHRSISILAGFCFVLSSELYCHAPRGATGANVNLEFAAYLLPSEADRDQSSKPVPLSPEDEGKAAPSAENDEVSKVEVVKMTPEQEAKLVRYAGRDGTKVLPLLGGQTTSLQPYRGASTIEFFRETKGPDGRLEKTVIGTYEFPAKASKVLLFFRSTDLNQTFQVEGVEVTDELFPKGRLLFVNGTDKAFELEVAGVKHEVQPKLSAKGSLEALKDYKIPCKLSLRSGEGAASVLKKVYSTNLYFARQDLRIVYYIHMNKDTNRFDMIAVDPFQSNDK